MFYVWRFTIVQVLIKILIFKLFLVNNNLFYSLVYMGHRQCYGYIIFGPREAGLFQFREQVQNRPILLFSLPMYIAQYGDVS